MDGKHFALAGFVYAVVFAVFDVLLACSECQRLQPFVGVLATLDAFADVLDHVVDGISDCFVIGESVGAGARGRRFEQRRRSWWRNAFPRSESIREWSSPAVFLSVLDSRRAARLPRYAPSCRWFRSYGCGGSSLRDEM